MGIFLSLTIGLFLILLNAFFVLAEFAFVKVRSTRLEELVSKGNIQAVTAQKILQQLDSYLSAIQLGITMASLGLGWIGEPAMARLIALSFPYFPVDISAAFSHTLAFGAAFVVITSMHVTLGEQVPKLVAIKNPDISALWTAYPLVVFHYLVYLPMKLLNDSAYTVLRFMGFKPDVKAMTPSEEEMRLILGQSREQGKLSLGRLLMFENIFDFAHCVARDIMTPRNSIACIVLSKPWAENLETIRKRKFSRYPLCKTGLDDAMGYVLFKDLAFEQMETQSAPDLEKRKRSLLTVPEDASAERLLREFQEKKLQLALVADKDNRVTGLVTLENVLEEIVGEIRDEIDITPATILGEAFVPEASIIGIEETERFAAMRRLLASLHASRPVFNLDEAWQLLARREEVLTCALGHGTAFPHARLPGLAVPLLVFGRAKSVVNFPVILDREPVKLLFLILTPAQDNLRQLKILSRLASLVSNYNLRKELLRAASPKEVAEIISTFERRISL